MPAFSWFRAAALASLVALPVPASSAQEADLSVSTQLVMVDVLVEDADGAVGDLGADDFQIYDNGVPQVVAVFEAVSGENDPEDRVTLPAGVASNRRDWQGATPTSATVILVDRMNTPTSDQVFMNGLLLDFMESFGQQGRLALYELGNELRIIHDFTRNPQELVRLVGEMEPEHSLALEGSDTGGGFETGLGTAGIDRGLSEFAGRGGRGAFEGQFGREASDYFLQNRAQRTTQALEVITHHLEGLPGRKNIVWLSGRFPFTFYPRQQTDLAQEVETSTLLWMEDVGRQLTSNNIAIYPVDIRGPGTPNDDSYVQGIMRTIAEMTGGRGYYGTNSVGEAIEQAVTDASMTYSIGFYPAQPGENGVFRTIDVEVELDGARLHHRPGYFAFSDPELSGSPSVVNVLASPLDANSLGLVGRAVPTENRENYQVLVLVDLNDVTLQPREDRQTGSLDFAAFFQPSDTEEEVRVLPLEVLPINLTEESYGNALGTGFVIQKLVETDGFDGRLRVVVQDRISGNTGSLWIPVGEPRTP